MRQAIDFDTIHLVRLRLKLLSGTLTETVTE